MQSTARTRSGRSFSDRGGPVGRWTAQAEVEEEGEEGRVDGERAVGGAERGVATQSISSTFTLHATFPASTSTPPFFPATPVRTLGEPPATRPFSSKFRHNNLKFSFRSLAVYRPRGQRGERRDARRPVPDPSSRMCAAGRCVGSSRSGRDVEGEEAGEEVRGKEGKVREGGEEGIEKWEGKWDWVSRCLARCRLGVSLVCRWQR